MLSNDEVSATVPGEDAALVLTSGAADTGAGEGGAFAILSEAQNLHGQDTLQVNPSSHSC